MTTRKRMVTQSMIWDGDTEAKRLFGPLGVCMSSHKGVIVGKFTRHPNVGQPPWPIEVWGEGVTVDQAVQEAKQALLVHVGLEDRAETQQPRPQAANAE